MKTLFKYSMLIVGVIIFPSVAFCQTPTITSFSPMTGYYGTLITLTGTNLSSPTSVTIGGTSVLIVVSVVIELTRKIENVVQTYNYDKLTY